MINTHNVEYFPHTSTGLYNPEYLVVCNDYHTFSGYGIESFMSSRGVRTEESAIVPNTFQLGKIVSCYTKGGNIEQGTYIKVELVSTTTEDVIHLEVPTKTIFKEDNYLFKDSVIVGGNKFQSSTIYSVITHNATPTLVLFDSSEYKKYVSEWERHVKDILTDRKELAKKKTTVDEKYQVGKIYVGVETSNNYCVLTKYVYVGKQRFPTIKFRKQDYLSKGTNQHCFVVIESIHYLTYNEEIKNLISHLKEGKLTETELKLNGNRLLIEPEEEHLRPKVASKPFSIKQPYFNLYKGMTENIIEKDSILSPFSVDDKLFTTYTKNELAESNLYGLKECEEINVEILLEEMYSFAESIFGNTTRNIKEFFEDKKSYLSYPTYSFYVNPKLAYEKHLCKEHLYDYSVAYFSKLYLVYLKSRDAEITFEELFTHTKIFPIDFPYTANVRAKKDVTYVSETKTSHRTDYHYTMVNTDYAQDTVITLPLKKQFFYK